MRDELEHLLDDDDDMAEMYLTEKLEEQLGSSSVSTVDEQDELDEAEAEADVDERHVTLVSFYKYFKCFVDIHFGGVYFGRNDG